MCGPFRSTAVARRNLAVLTCASMLLALSACSHLERQKTQEALLRKELFTMREQIDQFTVDKRKAPKSLQEVVSAGYLKAIPLDPFTNSRETWVPVQTEMLASIDQSEPGISDVHSGSSLVGTDGTPYSSW